MPETNDAASEAAAAAERIISWSVLVGHTGDALTVARAYLADRQRAAAVAGLVATVRNLFDGPECRKGTIDNRDWQAVRVALTAVVPEWEQMDVTALAAVVRPPEGATEPE